MYRERERERKERESFLMNLQKKQKNSFVFFFFSPKFSRSYLSSCHSSSSSSSSSSFFFLSVSVYPAFRLAICLWLLSIFDFFISAREEHFSSERGRVCFGFVYASLTESPSFLTSHHHHHHHTSQVPAELFICSRLLILLNPLYMPLTASILATI